MRAPTYNCGHPRAGENRLTFKNGGTTASRCRKCHLEYQLARSRAGRGALRLVIQMHVEGTLSEGQVATATGLHRVAVRELADSLRQSQAAA